MYVLSRVTALTGVYLQSALIRLLKHLSIRLAREKEVLRQHEKADLCWPVSLLFHSMKFPDKCFHGKFRLAEFSSLQHTVVFQTHWQKGSATEPSGFVVQTDRGRGIEWRRPSQMYSGLKHSSLGINNHFPRNAGCPMQILIVCFGQQLLRVLQLSQH